MSGVDKSASPMLTHGRAGKARYSSDTDDMFEHLEAGDHAHSWTTETKCNMGGRSMQMNFNVNFDKGANGMECTSGWDMKRTSQMGGLTFQSTYNHGNGKMSGFIDWGEVYPNVNFFQGLNHNANSTDFTGVAGFSYVGENWGGVGEFASDQNENKTYSEKSWFETGPLALGTNV